MRLNQPVRAGLAAVFPAGSGFAPAGSRARPAFDVGRSRRRVQAGNAPVLHSMTDLKFGYNATGCADPLARQQVGRERIPSMERHPE